MGVIKGDFLGFTFDGIHSSELGIFRVSDGSRYNENLLPTMQDKTVQIPGADGTYYFGSFYTQKPFSLSIAFDSLSDEGIRKLKMLFGDKQIHDLIFDEAPYKVYKVKSTGTPNLKYVAFDKEPDKVIREVDTLRNKLSTKDDLYGAPPRMSHGRVYKGEGTLTFTAYTPYARSRYKYLDQYNYNNIPEWGSLDNFVASDVFNNLEDWQDMSGLIPSDTCVTIDGVKYIIDQHNGDKILVYNAGDIPTHFNLILKFDKKLSEFQLIDETGLIRLELKGIELEEGDTAIKINGQINLIEGVRADGTTSGKIYNKYITKGDFFKMPPMEKPVLYTIKTARGQDLEQIELPKGRMKGDINGDGFIRNGYLGGDTTDLKNYNAYEDYMLLYKHLSSDYSVQLEGEALWAANINNDKEEDGSEKVDFNDMQAFSQYFLGKENPLTGTENVPPTFSEKNGNWDYKYAKIVDKNLNGEDIPVGYDGHWCRAIKEFNEDISIGYDFNIYVDDTEQVQYYTLDDNNFKSIIEESSTFRICLYATAVPIKNQNAYIECIKRLDDEGAQLPSTVKVLPASVIAPELLGCTIDYTYLYY